MTQFETESALRGRQYTRRSGILVAHTHWDRAWYLPFEQFRMRLVRLIDRLIDILDGDPEFRCFMLDGQMIVIEDYLEVRPERRADLERLARAGRLQVGPWYVLPDEFLVSPEAFIRNLERGIRLAEPFGGATRVGYEPDSFGHIGQLPQIFAGFGIDNAVFWRGLGEEIHRLGSEFWWAAPDGTRVLAIFLPLGYGHLSFLGFPAQGDEAVMPYRVEWATERLEAAIGQLAEYANTPSILLMSGVDHEEANRYLPDVVREANRALQNAEIRIGSLREYIDGVRSAGVTLEDYSGELRSGAVANVLQQVYSARMELKQRNTFCQNLLERYAEPFGAYASLLGGDDQPEFLDLAWRTLMKNHPHDDICGCSVDRVHRQMQARFDSVEQITLPLVRDAQRYLIDRIALSDETEVPLFVFNPNGRAYEGTLVTALALASSQEQPSPFSIRDERGSIIPHQELRSSYRLDMEVNRPRPTTLVEVALALPPIPPCGYRTLRLGPPGEQPVTALRASGTTLENEYLRVEVGEDGTISLTDKTTGARFERLHGLEDTEDTGDEYTYCPAPHGKTLTEADAQIELQPLESGPVRAGTLIRYHLRLPQELAQDRSRRSDTTVEYLIETEVWLGAGDRRVELVTRVTNNARDHRLRVIFPTPIHTDIIHADGHFDVVARPATLPTGGGWFEPPSPTAHQRTFVDVNDGQVGLAVLNRGLPEYEALPSKQGVGIALTLLRCVGWLSRGAMATRPTPAGPELPTPEGQCPGPYEFQYALEPHAGSWGTVIHDATAYNAPCTLMTGRTTEGVVPSDAPSEIAWEPVPRAPELDILPESASFLTLEPADLVLSSVRRERGGEALLIRCYNPTEQEVTARLHFLRPVRRGTLVDFLGQEREEIAVHGGELLFQARPKGIFTIRCEFDARAEGAERRT